MRFLTVLFCNFYQYSQLIRIGTGPTTTNVNEPLIVVNHLGQAVYYEILQLTVFCKMNVRLFPFDSHECTQRYTSYTYDGKELRLHPKLDSSAAEYVAVQNGVWFLKNFKVKEIVEYYLCCPNPYVEIHVTLFIQRESSFYMFNIGIPTLFLSLITLSVFYLHPESGERISLSVSNVLALVIFQQLLAASMPPTGDHTPIIGE
ncbi:Neuronal acetylcholine receptor subunit alpha-9-II [Holothuria leucospilota]|uniref:Neuronal acetylcholine receptor subunit alpha-9-II n=1 Tax=Holothuria leucospilota TaxID=206669 RepID=A0A9Q1CI43_HOLLE|nr:Neuronal acetylcholine receptor subunit alpha-9-II [Holothuria leucospilota]